MDIATIASATTQRLMRYLEATHSVDEPFAEGTPDHIRELWRNIVAEFRSEPPAEVVIEELTAQPGSPDQQDLFRKKLEAILEEDAVLLSQLAVNVATDRPITREQEIAAAMNDAASDDAGVYPRPLRCRRRCEG
jgi:hypothetical protein